MWFSLFTLQLMSKVLSGEKQVARCSEKVSHRGVRDGLQVTLPMTASVWAAEMRMPRAGGFNNAIYVLSFLAWKSKMKVLADLGLRMAPSHCTCTWRMETMEESSLCLLSQGHSSHL